MDKAEVHKLWEYLDDLYKGVRGEQRTDDTFYKDTFAVPQIRNLARLQRTGRGARLVDAPAEHTITSNPQAFRFPMKDTNEAREKSLAVGLETNRWFKILKRQNPNPPKEFVKNLLLRGEAWIQVIHNEKWVTKPKIRKGLPVLFLTPDPMIIYADPNEDENGIPKRVIIHYEQQPSIIREKYPDFSPTLKDGKEPPTVERLEYIDEDQWYVEVDGQVLHDAENIYHIVPLAHKLSGFGKSSPEGKMEDLIVGRLRKVRDILIRECALVSDIDSIFHLFANRSIDFKVTDKTVDVPDDFASKYEFGPGLAHVIPYGIEVERSEEIMPEPQAFQYLAGIKAELEREDPLVMAGSAVGSTGRQQDMVMGSALARYDTLVENTEYAFATAFGMALQMCEKIPTLCPEEFGLKKEDIGENYEVLVALKADDPIESDRKATLGSRLYQQGEIDLRTNLVKYQGYSESEAEEIITNMMVDRVVFQSPEIMNIIAMKAAEKLGIADELQAIKMQEAMRNGNLAVAPSIGTPGQIGQARASEVQTPVGREMIDMALSSKGQRSPPSNYTRAA